jgi:hypothetical protein
MKRETRKTFTYSALPSVKKAAMKRAKKEGATLSDVIERLLQGYISSDVWKSVESGVPLPPDYVQLNAVKAIHANGTTSKSLITSRNKSVQEKEIR